MSEFPDYLNVTRTTIEVNSTNYDIGTKKILFSDQLAEIFQWTIFTFLSQAFNIFGVASNIINIICFVVQGFQDPVNISFLGLAVADIGCLVTLIWTNICYSPAFIGLDLPFEPMEFQYLTSGMLHASFNRISSSITAIITMERCLCITAPIKVKSIVTSKRVTILIVCVFIVFLAGTAPVYVVNRLGIKFYPERNKTLIGIVSSDNRESIEQVSYVINNVCIPFLAFAIIIFCTILLVIQLNKKTKWRKKSTTSSQSATVSARNQNVSKMAATISILYISCFTPLCILFMAMSFEPEISVYGRYKNAISIFGGICVLLESINASVNTIIYYQMSTKYRATLRQLFCLEKS